MASRSFLLKLIPARNSADFNRPSGTRVTFHACTGDGKSGHIGVSLIESDCAGAGLDRPTFYRWNDAWFPANIYGLFDTSGKERTDHTFMDETVTGIQVSFSVKLRHARRGTCSARAAVYRLVTIKDSIARIGLRIDGRAGPLDMGNSFYSRIFRMNDLENLVERIA